MDQPDTMARRIKKPLKPNKYNSPVSKKVKSAAGKESESVENTALSVEGLQLDELRSMIM